MKTKTLYQFLALTFGITWGLAILLFFFYDAIIAIFGDISTTNPLYILAVYSPGIAGLFLVVRQGGFKGLGRFLHRLTMWRAPLHWWLFLILGIPALMYAGAALNGTLGDPFPFSPWYQMFPALGLALLLGPIEEFGWRGLALPLLQRKYAPFWSGLLLGVIWAVWHIPSFMMGGTPQSNWDFVPFFAGLVAISIIQTPLFNAGRGSLLMAVLYHFQIMNPVFPDAQPWDSLMIVLAAVIIVWLNRRKMFQRGSGVTDIFQPENNPDHSGQEMEPVRAPFTGKATANTGR